MLQKQFHAFRHEGRKANPLEQRALFNQRLISSMESIVLIYKIDEKGNTYMLEQFPEGGEFNCRVWNPDLRRDYKAPLFSSYNLMSAELALYCYWLDDNPTLPLESEFLMSTEGRNIMQAFITFVDAANLLSRAWSEVDTDFLNDDYPFKTSLDDLVHGLGENGNSINKWLSTIINKL